MPGAGPLRPFARGALPPALHSGAWPTQLSVVPSALMEQLPPVGVPRSQLPQTCTQHQTTVCSGTAGSVVASHAASDVASTDRQDSTHLGPVVREFLFMDVGSRFKGLAKESMSLQLLIDSEGHQTNQVMGVGHAHGIWLSDDDTLVIQFNCRGDDAN